MHEFVSITLRGSSKGAVFSALDKMLSNLPNSITPVKLTTSKSGNRVSLKCAIAVKPYEDEGVIDAFEFDYTNGHATATVEPELYKPLHFSEGCPKCGSYLAYNFGSEHKCIICEHRYVPTDARFK